jgi:hypothetical protein
MESHPKQELRFGGAAGAGKGDDRCDRAGARCLQYVDRNAIGEQRCPEESPAAPAWAHRGGLRRVVARVAELVSVPTNDIVKPSASAP